MDLRTRVAQLVADGGKQAPAPAQVQVPVPVRLLAPPVVDSSRTDWLGHIYETRPVELAAAAAVAAAGPVVRRWRKTLAPAVAAERWAPRDRKRVSSVDGWARADRSAPAAGTAAAAAAVAMREPVSKRTKADVRRTDS